MPPARHVAPRPAAANSAADRPPVRGLELREATGYGNRAMQPGMTTSCRRAGSRAAALLRNQKIVHVRIVLGGCFQ
jgi:hypothetical protein